MKSDIAQHLDKLTKDQLIQFIIEENLYNHPKLLAMKTKEPNIPFSAFREKYAYKKGDKLGTEKKWNRLTDKERNDAMAALDIYLKERDPRYIAMPQTWITQKRRISILEAEMDKQKQKQRQVRQERVIAQMNPLAWKQ